MPNYKEMYLKMFRASEAAINTLSMAQRACEESYINRPEPEPNPASITPANKKSADEE